MYTQNDGAWIKNVAEEARMIEAMRKGADHDRQRHIRPRHHVDRPVFAQGADSQAIDRAEQECK